MKHDELILGLKRLFLHEISQQYIEISKLAEKEKKTYEQYLAHLITIELNAKHQQKIKRLIQESKIPLHKGLESYNFDLRSGITQQQFSRLTNGEFVRQAGNLVFFGSFGVGKTHLAIALCLKLCEAGFRCLFTSTHGLLNQLVEAKSNLTLASLFKRLDKYDLILYDELGYIPHDQNAADLFFQLISQRDERKSILITTNLTYSEWDKVFLNTLTTAAAVDRIIRNCETFNISGESFREIEARNRLKTKDVKKDLTSLATPITQ